MSARTFERDGEHLRVRVPMQLYRRNGRKQIILPDGATTKPVGPNGPLVLAVARAFFFQELLDSGRYESISELAAAFNLERSYVGRLLRLALLAPWEVEAILDGREPEGTTVRGLMGNAAGAWKV